jgi:hypothetical protein
MFVSLVLAPVLAGRGRSPSQWLLCAMARIITSPRRSIFPFSRMKELGGQINVDR